MIKLYYLLLIKKIHILKYIRYNIDLLKNLFSKKFFWVRDEWNTNKRLKTFVYYWTEDNKSNFITKLDEKGRLLADLLVNKINKIIYNNVLPYNDIFVSSELEEQEIFARFCLKNEKEIPFNINEIWSYLNYFYIKSFVKEFDLYDMKGKDIIDCWWYNWDSSLAMSKYMKKIGKIYCIEPEFDNYNKIKNIIEKRKENSVIPINLWLSDKKYNAKISTWGAWSNISWMKTDWKEISIDILDNLVNEYNINPWLIKWDIEWFEYASIVWAKNLIKKYKPLLLISIYHTWKDWFEILPLIDSWNLGYKFTLRRWNCFHPFADTLLICY